MPKYIDPEELPFTVEELFDAAKRFLPEDNARLLADHLAECGPDVLEGRTERRERWKRGGLPSADTAPTNDWHLPPELFPALAALSPELSRRVAELRTRLGPNYVRGVD